MTEREFELSRRDLLRYAAQGAALVGTGSLADLGRRWTARSRAPPMAARRGSSVAGRYRPA